MKYDILYIHKEVFRLYRILIVFMQLLVTVIIEVNAL